MNRTPHIDFRVRSHGTVWTFEPLTEAAKEVTATELNLEGWQWYGPAFGVDHRPAHDLVTALEAEGFVVQR